MKKRLLALLAAAALAALAIAGCGTPAGQPATAATTAAAATAAAPEATEPATTAPAETSGAASETASQPEASGGGEKQYITLHLPSNPTMLDPALTSDGQGGILAFMMEPIMRVDKDYKLIPGIAESYESNEDATVYTYKIRSGVKFHDGTDCDAEAVKWNYERQIGDNATPDMPYAATIFSKVEKIEAPDATTLVITLSDPDGTLPTYLAMPNGTAIVSPTAWQADPEGFQKKPVGAGPYTFVEWIEDQSVKLDANPNYYGGEVMNAGVNFKVIKEPSVLTSEYLAGGVDYLTIANYTDIDQIEAAGFQVRSRPNLGYNFLSFADYESNELFKDERLRQAVAHALDRKALVNGIYSGYMNVAYSPIPIGMYGGDAEYTVYEYDVEKAKALMADAGYPDGFEFDFVTRSEPEYSTMAAAVQMELAKVGITMNVEILQKAEWLEKVFMEVPDHDMIAFNWGAAANDPSYMAALWLSSNAGTGYNTSGYSNPEFDSRIDSARKTADTAEQGRLYAQAAQMVNDDAACVFLQEQTSFWSTRDYIVDPEGNIGLFHTNPWWMCSKTN
jgi:peptide/nickel transport system substrate-binding protein